MSRELARAISALSNGDAEARRSLDLTRKPALTVGITGPPGAGKSTVIDALLGVVQKPVAVLAVDPTSPFTGGALLGDRIRMNNAGPGVFIRSLASRGHGGGLAPAAREVISLLAAYGYETVLLETVGVGQEDIEIARIADVTAVVLTPGAGDTIQAEKAGLLEAADLIVLNKCDLAGSERLESELREATGLPIIRMIATIGQGAAELLRVITETRTQRKKRPPAEFAIDHLGIAVASLELGLEFYYQQLGLQPGQVETVEHEQVRVVMLTAGESRIELLEATDETSAIAKFIEKRGPGLHHLALRVPDFAACIATLKSSGLRLVGEPRLGAGGHQYVFVHPAATGGVLLELIANEHT